MGVLWTPDDPTPRNGRPTREQLTNELAKFNEFVQNDGLATRFALGKGTGVAFKGKRQLDDAFGYKKRRERVFEDYWEAYRSQDIAKAIINAPVRASWRIRPTVSDGGDAGKSAFDKAWAALCKRIPVYRLLSRADRLCGVGEYSVVFMGTNDSSDLRQPRGDMAALKYVKVFSQGSATITKKETDTANERFALPTEYRLVVENPHTVSEKRMNTDPQSGKGYDVHWSRVLHITGDLLESDTYGVPELEAVYNRLQNIETILGASAESYWRNAYPGLAFVLDEKARVVPGSQAETDIDQEIDEYIHDLRRIMRFKGMTLQQLTAAIADPKSNIDVQLDMIAGATRRPKRILIGSERGELASSQDSENWANVIEERQMEICEQILRQFIDFCIAIKELPEPTKAEYTITWPKPPQSRSEQATEAATIAQAAATFGSSPAAEVVIPLPMFRRDYLHWTQDQIEEAAKHDAELEAEMAEEEAEAKEEAEALAEQMGQQQPPLGENGQPAPNGGPPKREEEEDAFVRA